MKSVSRYNLLKQYFVIWDKNISFPSLSPLREWLVTCSVLVSRHNLHTSSFLALRDCDLFLDCLVLVKLVWDLRCKYLMGHLLLHFLPIWIGKLSEGFLYVQSILLNSPTLMTLKKLGIAADVWYTFFYRSLLKSCRISKGSGLNSLRSGNKLIKWKNSPGFQYSLARYFCIHKQHFCKYMQFRDWTS